MFCSWRWWCASCTVEDREKVKAITGEYCTALLEQLKQAVKTKGIFHHDNSPAHMSSVVAAKVNELLLKLIL